MLHSQVFISHANCDTNKLSIEFIDAEQKSDNLCYWDGDKNLITSESKWSASQINAWDINPTLQSNNITVLRIK